MTCAKAKIKCDKMSPTCGRCARLGLECHAQLRGRGRPPNTSKPQTHKPTRSTHATPTAQPTKAQRPAAKGVFSKGGYSKVMAPPATEFFSNPQGARNEYRSSLVAAILQALHDAAPNVDKPGARDKFTVVAAWLKNTVSLAGNEELVGEIADAADTLGLDCDDIHDVAALFGNGARDEYSDPRPLLSAAEKARVTIPNFVAGLDGDGAALLVQATVGGASGFLANGRMEGEFMSCDEAEAIHAGGNAACNPDAVMRHLVAPEDHQVYMDTVCRLLVSDHGLNSEAHLKLKIRARTSSRRASPFVACNVHMRAAFATSAGCVVVGIKLTPAPVGGANLKRGLAQQSEVVSVTGAQRPNKRRVVPSSRYSAECFATAHRTVAANSAADSDSRSSWSSEGYSGDGDCSSSSGYSDDEDAARAFAEAHSSARLLHVAAEAAAIDPLSGANRAVNPFEAPDQFDLFGSDSFFGAAMDAFDSLDAGAQATDFSSLLYA